MSRNRLSRRERRLQPRPSPLGPEIYDKLRNKSRLYEALSTKCILPKYNSKDITVKYLRKVMENDPNRPSIFILWRDNMRPMTVLSWMKSRYTAATLVQTLEEKLIAQGKPGLGFEPGKYPDLEWLVIALHHEFPEKAKKMYPTGLKKRIQEEGISINPM